MAAFSATSLSGANSYQGFLSLVSRELPSASNLYWVRFRQMPEVLKKEGDTFFNKFFTGSDPLALSKDYIGPGTDESRLLTYYASDVTIPSRQITTGDAKTVGSMYRYPTGTSFSEISMQFILPRTMKTRVFFERWMNYMTNDASQRVEYYDNCVCPFLDIVKYERGGVTPIYGGDSYSSIVSPTASKTTKDTVQWNRASGVWVLKNAFPFNISNINLNANASSLITMEVSFYYERYRFYVPKQYEPEDIKLSAEATNTIATRLKATTPGTSNTPPAATPTIIVNSKGDGTELTK